MPHHDFHELVRSVVAGIVLLVLVLAHVQRFAHPFMLEPTFHAARPSRHEVKRCESPGDIEEARNRWWNVDQHERRRGMVQVGRAPVGNSHDRADEFIVVMGHEFVARTMRSCRTVNSPVIGQKLQVVRAQIICISPAGISAELSGGNPRPIGSLYIESGAGAEFCPQSGAPFMKLNNILRDHARSVTKAKNPATRDLRSSARWFVGGGADELRNGSRPARRRLAKQARSPKDKLAVSIEIPKSAGSTITCRNNFMRFRHASLTAI